MAKKVSAVMATQVALDTLSSVNSMKDLTSAVKVATGAWKSQETLLKSTGEYLKASEARYNGLGEAISRQKDKVEALKAKQSGLNVETKEGAQTYLKYQQDIDKATTQLNAMTTQQQRAKQSMDLQKSGIISLNQELKNGDSVTKSYVERLKAEGKETEAVKAKQTGLRESLSKQQELYKKQVEVLEQVATRSGKTSDEYQKQQVRVNELGTKIAHTKTEMKELDTQLGKKPTFGLSAIKNQLGSVNDKAEKTSHLFAKLVGVHLVADGITNGLASIQAHLHDVIEEGSEYVKKQQEMGATWNTLTGSAEKGNAMVAMGNKLSVAFGNNIEVVDELNQQFYHVLNNQPATEKLTASVLTMGDAVGMSSENLKNLGLNFTHMMSSTLLQVGDFNHITDALPMYGEELLKYEQKVQKNSKLTMKTLRDQMSAGKISAKDAQAVMEELGDKYKDASENLMKTIPGMERVITSRMPAIIGAIEKPIMGMKNPVLGAISKWVSDSNTEKEFGKVGDAATKGLQTITKAFTKVFDIKDGTKFMDDGVNSLADGITRASESIAKHAPDIVSFFKSTKEAGGTSFTIFVQTLQDLEPVLKIVGGFAKENPKLFAEMAAGMLIANKATQGLNLAFSGLGTVFKLSSGIFSTIKFPFDQISKMSKEGTKANKVLGGMKTTFSTLGSVFKTVGSGIGAATKFAFSSVVNQAKLMGRGLAAVGKAGGKALKFTAKLGWSAVKGGSKLLGKTLLGTAKIGAKALKFTAKLTWKAVKSGSKLLGKALVTTGKAGMKALKFTAKISVKAAQLALKGLLKSAQLTGKGLKLAFSFAKANPFFAITAAIVAVVAGLVALYKHNKKFRDFVNGIVKSATSMAKNVAKWFTTMWKDSVKIFNNMFKFIKPIFSNGFNVIQNYGKVFKDLFSGNWKNLDKDVRGVINSLIKFWKSAFTGVFNFVNKLTGGRLGDMVNTFKSYFGKLGGIVSGAINGVKKGAVGIARGVITPVNKMLEGLKTGLNWVLSKVGAGTIKASWSVPLPAYAKGTRGAHPGGLALVNDSPTSKYREMYHLPNGQFGIFPKKRNMIVPLPKGAEVLDGDSSHQLASMMGLPMYKNGIGSFFSGMWDKAKDIAEEAENIIAHPIKFMESVFTKFVGNSSKGFAGDIITGFPKNVASGAVNWVKKLFDGLGGSADNPGGAGVNRWKSTIKKAARKMKINLSSAGMSAVLKRIAQESNGNPTISNNWDSNAKAGTPSKGLLQYIQPTLSAWVPKGVKPDLGSGYAQLVALFNDSNWLRDISVSGGWGPTGHKRMANGGLITRNQMIEVAEQNKPEMVIPLDSMKRSRSWQLVGEVVSRLVADDPSMGKKSTTHDDKGNEELKQLNAKFDMLLQMFSKLLGLTAEQIEAIKAGAFNKNEQYKQQALDQILRDTQSI
ncbi:tape measure protein [Latilactobacillus sp. 5-91]|uniref:tape measure protein n=1 Tax=Latilactobacillus sp. 5-91 TaxID=3410924 RepID=UPI003C72CCBD